MAHRSLDAAAGRWRMTGALILLLTATSTAFFGLVSGGAWWFAMVPLPALVLAAAALLRTLGVIRSLVPICEAVLLLGLLTVFFGNGTGLAGVIPTPATFGHFGDLLAQARLSVERQAAPADSLPEFLFLIAAFAGVAAIMMDVLANTLRVPALTALVVAAVLIAPSTFLETGTTPLALAACAAAYLFVLRTDIRKRRRGWPEVTLSLSIAAAATLVAILVATTAPGFQQIGRQALTGSGLSIGGGVNPLIDLGQDLRRPVPVNVLQYTTTVETPPYLRMTSLDQFTGAIWRHRADETKLVTDRITIGPAPGLSTAVKKRKIRTTVHIQNMESAWVPAPYPVTGIQGLYGTWRWNANDLTVAGSNVSTQGQNYSASGLVIEPTAKQLQKATGPLPPAVSKDLFVPFDSPAIISKTAARVSAGATNNYQKALDLQNYFQDDGFIYSTTAPVDDSYDGDSMQSIAAFLRVKSGYCVHFAASMAVMARTLGIPSRIAMGYLPGTVTTTENGADVYQVSSDDLHAWPELYFAGLGWIAFEPTVSRGSLPAYTLSGGPAVSAPTPSASAAPRKSDALVSTDPTAGTGGGPSSDAEAVKMIVSNIALSLFVIALLLLPAAVRRWQRISRVRKLGDDWGYTRLAWLELRQSARDLGIAVTDTETPRQFAHRVASILGESSAAAAVLHGLLEAHEREEFGRAGHGIRDAERANQLTAVLHAMSANATPGARARAVLLPASLLPSATQVTRSPWSAR